MKCFIFLFLVSFSATASVPPLEHHLAINFSKINKIDEVCPDDLLNFAQSLIGTPYRSAASNPSYGFDCSGFVSYVFKNFNFEVPRSSCEFIGIGKKVNLADAKPGDIILFTGTSKHSRKIGHVGIIMSNENEEVKFIHSTSGKEHGVTITVMDKTYKRRYVQIIRMLKQNDES